jgi:hypothetical protein
MRTHILIASALALFISCNNNEERPVDKNMIGLKRGSVISCGPQDGEIFGSVSFDAAVPASSQNDFNTAIALLA